MTNWTRIKVQGLVKGWRSASPGLHYTILPYQALLTVIILGENLRLSTCFTFGRILQAWHRQPWNWLWRTSVIICTALRCRKYTPSPKHLCLKIIWGSHGKSILWEGYVCEPVGRGQGMCRWKIITDYCSYLLVEFMWGNHCLYLPGWAALYSQQFIWVCPSENCVKWVK